MRSRRYSVLGEALLFLGAAVMVIPVVLIFLTSLKADSEVVKFAGVLPQHPTVENFRSVLGTPEEFPVARWFFNSVFISSATTALVLTVTSLAAYGLARLRLPGGKLVFGLILGTMMVPGQILLVPVYLILNRLGWIDTPLALIVPAGSSAFGVFLLHQFFKTLPRELEESASMDGCGRLRSLWSVVLPVAKPALATLGIFTFVGSWNDFLGPLVFLDSSEHYTLPVGVAIFQSSYFTQYGLTLAASVLCTAPILVVFLVFQKHIVQGIAAAGLKD